MEACVAYGSVCGTQDESNQVQGVDLQHLEHKHGASGAVHGLADGAAAAAADDFEQAKIFKGGLVQHGMG